MTDRVMQLYYSNRVYYSIERNSNIDNPDQVCLLRVFVYDPCFSWLCNTFLLASEPYFHSLSSPAGC